MSRLQLLRTLGSTTKQPAIFAMAPTPDGAGLWIATKERLSLYNLKGEKRTSIPWEKPWLQCQLAYSGAALLACTFTADVPLRHEVRLYQLQGEQLECLFSFETPAPFVTLYQEGTLSFRQEGQVQSRLFRPGAEPLKAPRELRSLWPSWDGELLLGMSDDGKTLRAYHVPRQAFLWSSKPFAPVVDCAFLTQGTALLCLEDGAIIEVSLKDGAPFAHHGEHHAKKILATQDRSQILVLSREEKNPSYHHIKLFDRTFTLQGVIEESCDPGLTILSPTGSFFATVTDRRETGEGTLKLYKLPSMEEREIEGFGASPVVGLSWLDDNRLLSATQSARTVDTWDINKKEIIWRTELQRGGIQKLRHLPGGEGFVVAERSGVVSVYDFEWGASLGSFAPNLGEVTALETSPDGAYFFASFSGAGGTKASPALCAWRVGASESLWLHGSLSYGVPRALSCLGGVLTVFYPRHIAQYEPASGRELRVYEVNRSAISEVFGGLVSSDGQRVWFVEYLGYEQYTKLCLWDAAGIEPARVLATTEKRPGFLFGVGSLVFYLDEDSLFVLEGGAWVKERWERSGSEIGCVALSPGGRFLAVGTASGAIEIFWMMEGEKSG